MPTKRIDKYWIYLDGDSSIIKLQNIAISEKKLRMFVGDTKLLAYSVKPQNASYSEITWESDNPFVADVDENGKVTAKHQGTTSIHITINRKRATCIVNVIDIIHFADEKVKRICVRNWDKDGDGELSKIEASRVREIPLPLFTGQPIESFDELAYFTGLKTIGMHAFDSCTYLTSVTLPQSLEKIGKNAFSHCSSLQTITLTPKVSDIGTGAFTYCDNLETVYVNRPIPPLNGERIFDYCSNLTSIQVPGESVPRYCDTTNWGIDEIGDNLYYAYIWPHGFDYTFDFYLS